MTRTSISHPLQIAAVLAGPGLGRIGVTFCPGKVQVDAATGVWRRDLDVDVKAIAAWGAAAVVTLVEGHELQRLHVADLGEVVQRHHMDWLHLPIRDVDVPSPSFEAAWTTVGEGLRARLRAGFDVVIHCKGGLGRAGTVAARLLRELGWDADAAIAAVRAARPGALETSAQDSHVRAITPLLETQPLQDEGALPFPREAFEDAIRASGVAVDSNLKGFAEGFDAARQPVAAPDEPAVPTPEPTTPIGQALAARIRARMPAIAHRNALLGIQRLMDYQDQAYAALHLERLERIAALNQPPHALTTETAAALALELARLSAAA